MEAVAAEAPRLASLRRLRSAFWPIGLAAAALITPFMFGDSTLGVLTYCGAFAIGAIGLNLVTGLTGQVSLAQGFFLGVGGYTATSLGAGAGLPFIGYAVAAMALGALIGGATGLLSLRLRGHYLAIVTLGLVVVGTYLFNNLHTVTGGPNGRSAVEASVAVGPVDFAALGSLTRAQGMFLLVVAVLAVVAFAASRITRSRPGRALQAIQDGERAAEAIGVDVRGYKIAAFAIASALGALAGALYAPVQQFVNPTDFGLIQSILFLEMIIIGGLGSVSGAVIGAFFVWGGQVMLQRQAESALLAPVLRESPGDGGILTAGELSAIVFGLLVVVLLIAEPGGLVAVGRRLRGWITRRVGFAAAARPG
jgi:branched-chain amino acid transport system permease protein